MARLLASQAVTVLGHIFIDILITNRRLLIGNALALKCLIKTEVRHNRGDNRIVDQRALFFHVFSTYIEDLVAIHQLALTVHCQAAIRISIISKSNIQMIFNHIFLQSPDVSGTAICIDIQTIRRVVDDMCLRAQCVEYVFRNRGSASVCTVQTYPHIFERPCCQGNQITDIAVASRRIVNGASDRIALGKWNLAHLAIQIRLNLLDRLLLQFLAASVDDLDSVVIVWIVACGDHDTAVKLLCAYNIRYTRSGCHVKQIDICAGSGQSRYQRILKHIAAASRILADHNPAAICFRLLSIVPAQETTYFIGVLHGQRHICLAAESVCSKIFTHFESSSYIIKYRVQRSCTFMEIPH